MQITGFKTGGLHTNNYVVSHNGVGILVDCGDDPEKVLAEIGDIKISAVLITHTHFDHVLGLGRIYEKIGAPPIYVHSSEVHFMQSGVVNPKGWPDRPELPQFDDSALHVVEDGDELTLADMKICVIHTPGHCMGCVSYVINDTALFTGDLLFWNTVGRTDLPTSNESDLQKSIETVYSLPENLMVYPGHGKFGFSLAERKQHPLKMIA